MTLTAADTAPLVAPLLYWYRANARRMPWRDDPTPYHVWISEVMLQQTRVEAVRQYYTRFLEQFPDIPSLAAAEEDVLLKCWEGLGYYSRARNLRRGAVTLCARYGGALPADVASLLQVPGIGPYTAGAIASIAYGLPAAAVDGNVLRVLSRIAADGRDIGSPALRAEYAAALEAVYPPGDCAAFTQALMELGACVCVPNGAPRCRDCPLRGLCRAEETGTASLYPYKTPKKPRRVEKRTVLLLWCGERWCVQKRASKGLLAGLWEFPSLDGECSAEEVKKAVREMGYAVTAVTPLPQARHIFTHLEWHMTGFCVRVAAPRPGDVFVPAPQLLADYALPSAFAVYRAMLAENSVQG